MKLLLLISSLLFLSCSTGNVIRLQLDENESGHYFIIWTSDSAKFSNDLSKPIRFDDNKVLYLNYLLYDSLEIKPFNLKGEDISNRLKNFMGNEFYMHFYNPGNKEYKEHPVWDTYYLNKQPTTEKSRLKSIGYNFEDSLIKQELTRLGKYRAESK